MFSYNIFLKVYLYASLFDFLYTLSVFINIKLQLLLWTNNSSLAFKKYFHRQQAF